MSVLFGFTRIRAPPSHQSFAFVVMKRPERVCHAFLVPAEMGIAGRVGLAVREERGKVVSDFI